MESNYSKIKSIDGWVEIKPDILIEDYVKYFKRNINEATGDRVGGAGGYVPPLQPGLRDFENKLSPFKIPVSDYKSPLVQYDSYDKQWDLRLDQIIDLEKTAKKVTDYIKHHPYSTFSDEDGNVINQNPSGRIKKEPFNLEVVPIERTKNKINEITTSTTAGEYNGPQELGARKWTKSELGGFTIDSNHPANKKQIKKSTKDNVSKIVGGWEPREGTFEIPTEPVKSKKEKRVKPHGELTNDPIEWYKNFNKKRTVTTKNSITEDLAVWFGKKKKPKGSSQPKGPWVDICRKVDGKHPPCGRSDASTGSYPKCRAAGVAGKMSDSAKRAACQQKRRAEKSDPQSGKGQKPVMTSYKPRKKTNENMNRIITLTEADIEKIVMRVLNEQRDPPTISPNQTLSLTCQNFTIYQDNGEDKIKLLKREDINGKLLTDSQVIQASSFQDVGHKVGDVYGSGFQETYDEENVMLKFNLKTDQPSFQVYGDEATDYDYTFILKPVSKQLKPLLGIQGQGENIIFNIKMETEVSFCKITKNDPSNEFLTTLTTNWGLNNAPFV